MVTFSGLHIPDIDHASIAARKYLLLQTAEGHSGDFSLHGLVVMIVVDLGVRVCTYIYYSLSKV
jgi:hypothetical protein